MGYIYGIRNKLNGFWYIGQSRRADIRLRWFEHRTLNVKKCKQTKINSAMRKYGLVNFDFKLICICFDDALDDMEKLYVEKYDSYGPRGYNLTAGGRDAKRSKASCSTQSAKFKEAGIHRGSRNPMFGRKHRHDSRKLISECQKQEVRQYTLMNVFVAQYESVMAAAASIGKPPTCGHIGQCCNGKRLTAYGFKWVWVPDGRKKTAEAGTLTPPIRRVRKKPSTYAGKVLRQYTLKNVFVAQFKTMNEALTRLGRGSGGHITDCCNGKRTSSYGFKWIWASESCPTYCEGTLTPVRVLKQYTLNNEFVADHESVKNACASIGLTKNGHIGSCCAGKRKSAHGFKWRWETVDVDHEYPKLSAVRELKQFTLDGVFVSSFPSIADASASLGRTRSSSAHISSCCSGKRPTAYGFKWTWEQVGAGNLI